MAVNSQTLDYDNLVVSTMAMRLPKIKAQVLKEHKVLALLTKNKETSGMGRQIEVDLEYGENNTVDYLSSIESEISVTDQQHLTKAYFTPALLAGVVKWNAEEKAQNSSKEKYIDLMKVKERRIKATFRRKLAQGLYGTGANRTTNGLGMYVPTAVGSNTVGGISEATAPWWRSQVRTSSGSFAANGIFGSANDYVLNGIINCTDEEMPDLIISDTTVFEYAHKSFGSDVRYVSNDTFGNIGKMELRYQGTRWVWDKDCDAATMFILHTGDFIFVTTAGMDFTPTPVMTPDKQPWVRYVAYLSRHQLVVNRRMLHMRLSGWAA